MCIIYEETSGEMHSCLIRAGQKNEYQATFSNDIYIFLPLMFLTSVKFHMWKLISGNAIFFLLKSLENYCMSTSWEIFQKRYAESLLRIHVARCYEESMRGFSVKDLDLILYWLYASEQNCIWMIMLPLLPACCFAFDWIVVPSEKM